jgi:hypothetical protein
MKRRCTRVVFCLAVLAFSLNALAAGKNGVVLSKDGRMATATKSSSKIVAQNINKDDTSLTKIFNNISIYPFARYFCCYGWTIAGPSSSIGQVWLAAPFTPAANVTATKVEVSAGWFGGTNKLVIAIYSDRGGVPGKSLVSRRVSNLFNFGTCCTLSTASFKAGVALRGGKQYWVVMSTDSSDADFEGAWAINTTDDRSYTFAVNTGSGWSTTSGFLGGYRVLGR